MSFFQRVMNHLFNQVLVEGLANARWFQRFAISSNKFFSEAGKKAAEGQVEVASKGSEFFKVFREEMKKGMDEIHKGGRR